MKDLLYLPFHIGAKRRSTNTNAASPQRPGMFTEALDELFSRAARGELRAIVGNTYPLEQAAQAHIDLRERRTTGKLLLDPAV